MPQPTGDRPQTNLLYSTHFPVRWGDMDAFGHVNNSTYFRYFEIARSEWLTGLGYPLSLAELQEGPTIVDAHCEFLVPVIYPATLSLSLYGGVPGRSSVNLYYELTDNKQAEKLYCRGCTRLVWINFTAGRSIPLPENIHALLP